MSGANVDRVRAAYAAYQQEGIEGLFPYFAADIEWDMTKTALDSRIHRGHDGVRRFFDGLGKTWDGFTFRYDEFLDAGDEVVAIGRFHARGKASGAEAEATMVHIWTLRGGMGIRLQAYLDKAQALRAVGLQPREP